MGGTPADALRPGAQHSLPGQRAPSVRNAPPVEETRRVRIRTPCGLQNANDRGKVSPSSDSVGSQGSSQNLNYNELHLSASATGGTVDHAVHMRDCREDHEELSHFCDARLGDRTGDQPGALLFADNSEEQLKLKDIV